MDDLSHRVSLFIQGRPFVTTGTTLVVGVSGGIDSVVLLHVLNHVCPSLGIAVHVATLDHGLRGEVGSADADFVVSLAHQMGLPCSQSRVDAMALAKAQKVGIEQAARLARYDFLAKVAHEQGSVAIATAHHADDQVETILMHLLRGSGTAGLVGMHPQVSVPRHLDLQLIRPFLAIHKSELQAYARDNELHWREDVTNADAIYTRNRIRLELLPMIRTINADADRALLRLADNAVMDEAFIVSHITGFWQTMAGSKSVVMVRAQFRDAHPALQRRLILTGARHVAVDLDLSQERVLAAVHLALHGEVGARLELGGGVSLGIDYVQIVIGLADTFRFDPQAHDNPFIDPEVIIALDRSGDYDLNGWVVRVSDQSPQNKDGDSITWTAKLSVPTDASLTIRSRRVGDRFALVGLEGHTRLVSKWMIDLKIPRLMRPHIPMLCADNHVIAIFWKGIMHSYALTSSAKMQIWIYLRRKQD